MGHFEFDKGVNNRAPTDVIGSDVRVLERYWSTVATDMSDAIPSSHVFYSFGLLIPKQTTRWDNAE